MPSLLKRQTAMILALVLALTASLIAIALDEDLRERMGESYWIVGMAIIGCVLLVLTGYVWDRSMVARLRQINESARKAQPVQEQQLETDQDEIIGVARQIERMAQALQKTEASYRAIVEDQVDLICRYRSDGLLTFVNGAYARFFGQKRQAMIGQLLPLVALGYPHREYQGNFLAAEEFEVELTNADGEPTQLAWTHRAITGRSGEVLEYQAVGHDVSARKKAEIALREAKEAAEAADRAKSEFLAVVSHEIRTPINGVIGFAKLLRETPLSRDQLEYVNNIQNSGMSLESLIADILDISKIEAGAIDINHSPFALRDCIADIETYFQERGRKSGIKLQVTVDPNVPVILNGDQNRLRQILLNLIGNAYKFTETGSIGLSLSSTRGDDIPGTNRRQIRLFFAVSDTGIGIPADKVSQLFRPFSQVDTSSTRRRGGTGLGLVISKKLCELMGGAISVESVPDQGSTFRFSLNLDYEKGDSRAPMRDTQPLFPISPQARPNLA